MFRRVLLTVSLACAIAAPALAEPTEFDPSWSAQDKFAWAQYNYGEYCDIPKSRDVRFEDLPGWMQVGLGWATEDQVIDGIRKSCGEELNAETAAAYNPYPDAQQ